MEQDVICDNEFEKMLLPEVIPPDELGVTFDHIGALDNVKETLRELVMLPLQRPELFVKGQLTKVSLDMRFSDTKSFKKEFWTWLMVPVFVHIASF